MYDTYTPNPMTMNGQYQNPYTSRRQEIVRVTGENGARAYQMFPNSSVLLLDETNPLIWLVQTDGAGYKTVTPYKITPYQPTPMISNEDIIARIEKLEAFVNGKSNITETKSADI